MTPQAKTRPAADPITVGEHDASLNIEQRLLNVMAALSYVQKTGVTAKEAGGYSFVTHDAVTAAVRPLLVKNGVLCLPTIVQHEREGNQTTLLVDLAFINTDNPEDRAVVRSVGYGIDKQDKGPGKAMNYAVKYGLLKAFSLETGDDVEMSGLDRDEPYRSPAPAGAASAAPHHTPGRPALAKFWSVARGQKVPEEVIRLWFKRNLGLESTKDADDGQLTEATFWAQAFVGRAKKLGDATMVMGFSAQQTAEEASRQFDGVTALGELTLKEWDALIAWAETNANATLDQEVAADDDLPF